MSVHRLSGPMLRSGEGEITGDDYLPADPAAMLWGELPGVGDAPAVAVRPGSTLTIDTLSHEGVLEDQGRDPLGFFAGHGVDADLVLPEAVAVAGSGRPHDPRVVGPHLVCGPVAVTGARPGDLLAMTVLETTRRVPYGVVSNRHLKGALPDELPRDGRTYSAFASVWEEPGRPAYGVLPLTEEGEGSVRFPLHPFLGIMGVATADGRRRHSVPPGAFGGNIDINLLTVGSTLYLPVQVPDALAYVGDPHFAQGDGEVSLTAMEASLRVTLRLDVVPRADAVERFGELVGPLAETADYLVPTGMDPDLDVATQNCVRAALALLGTAYGMDRPLAYAYLSAATDFDISQVVDVVKGVHARIRKADFTR